MQITKVMQRYRKKELKNVYSLIAGASLLLKLHCSAKLWGFTFYISWLPILQKNMGAPRAVLETMLRSDYVILINRTSKKMVS